jgi:hypothetical protein
MTSVVRLGGLHCIGLALMSVCLVSVSGADTSSTSSHLAINGDHLVTTATPTNVVNHSDNSSYAKNSAFSNVPTESNHTETDGCRFMTLDPQTYTLIRELLDHHAGQISLIDYRFQFPNHTSNPLLDGLSRPFRLDTWSRVSSNYGKSLLLMAFNYDIQSLMTLTLGVEKMVIELVDRPFECVWGLNESMKTDLLVDLMLRDFADPKTFPEATLVGEERVCHEVMEVENGRARFKDRSAVVTF